MTDGRETAPRRPLRQRLAFRLGLAGCLGVAVLGAVAGAVNVRLQRAQLTRLVQASAEREAETIRRSIREAMLRNSPEEAHRILESIGAQEGMDRIRIFDKEGRVRISTAPEEIGHVVDKRAEQCFGCHAAGEPLTSLARSDRIRIFRRDGEPRVLGIIAPMHNEPDCARACHGPDGDFVAHGEDQQVLGVLDVQMSLGPVDEQIAASEHQLGLGLLVTVLAVLLLVGLLVWRLVLRPVRRLTVAARKVGRGEIGTRVPVPSPDEIGEMARSWNDMLDELAEARRELESWSRTLESRVDEKSRALEAAHKKIVIVEKMASLGQLAAVVAHEINNPLAGIHTYAKLLHRRLAASARPEDEEGARVMKMIEEETARCGEIVRNLLLFSRTPGARFARHELRPLLERCLMLVRHKAEMEEIEVELDVPAGLALVGDASQVQQLFLALIMNAIEAMPEGGRLTVRAAPDEAGAAVAITVADTGVGIPPESLGHVFEPFFTTKEQGKGVGVGLAVAYGIVGRHHGTIEVDSVPGRTVFTVRLPLEQPAVEAAVPPAAEEVRP